MTVLVTAVGAIIGYGIVRALKRLPEPPRIIGTDIYADAVGQVWCDRFVQMPLTASVEYGETLEALIRRERIDAILPGVEYDVNWLDTHRDWIQRVGVPVALNTAPLVALGRDKWATHEFLVARGLPVIPTLLPGTFEAAADQLGVPFILKSRSLSAGKGMAVISTPAQFAACMGQAPNTLIAQQIVGTVEREYTVGVFGLGGGDHAGWIAMRRLLSREGSTSKAWVVFDENLDGEVARLTALMAPLGPTNLQFRYHDGRYLMLEINPRFSSSTSLRALFGFNEAEMSLAFFGRGARPPPPVIRGGHAVRFIEDMLLA